MKQLLFAGDLHGAEELLYAIDSDPVSAGNELRRMQSLYDRALLEIAAGRFDDADDHITEGVRAAQDTEDSWAMSLFRSAEGRLAVWRGDVERANEIMETAASSEHRREPRLLAWALSDRGLLALSRGDAVAAAEAFGRAEEIVEGWGMGNPGVVPVLPNAVEAFAIAGDLVRARSALETLAAQVRVIDGAWAAAVCERARATLLLAEGKPLPAAERLVPIADELESAGHLPDAARARLIRGRALLRGGRRGAAADALADARARFESMGARLWAERAASDLDRAAPGPLGR